SPDGSKVFVTGYSAGTPGSFNHQYFTIAYDASSGATLWGTRFSEPVFTDDVAYSAAVSPDGSKVFVTGYRATYGVNNDYLTIAYDASTGAILWGRRYNGPGNSTDGA